MSNGWKLPSNSVAIPPPRETEAGSAGKQPTKGDLGLRCANGVSGPCRDVSTRAVVFCTLDVGVMPQKIHCVAGGALESDEPELSGHGVIGPLSKDTSLCGTRGGEIVLRLEHSDSTRFENPIPKSSLPNAPKSKCCSTTSVDESSAD